MDAKNVRIDIAIAKSNGGYKDSLGKFARGVPIVEGGLWFVFGSICRNEKALGTIGKKNLRTQMCA